MLFSNSSHAQPGSYHFGFGFNLFYKGKAVDSLDGFIIENVYWKSDENYQPYGDHLEERFRRMGVETKKSLLFTHPEVIPLEIRIISPQKDTMTLRYFNRSGMDHFHFIDELEFKPKRYEVISYQFQQSPVLRGNEFFLNAHQDSAGFRRWYAYYDNDSSHLSTQWLIDSAGRVHEYMGYQLDSTWHRTTFVPDYRYRQFTADNQMILESTPTFDKQWNFDGELIFHRIKEGGEEQILIDRREIIDKR